jgi:hypothetical protein
MLGSCVDNHRNKYYFSNKFTYQTVADIQLFCTTMKHDNIHKIIHLNNKQKDYFCIYDNLYVIFKSEKPPVPIK